VHHVQAILEAENVCFEDEAAHILPLTGRVKFFDQEKGFGFARVKGHPDTFFHVSSRRDPVFVYGDTRLSLQLPPVSEDKRVHVPRKIMAGMTISLNLHAGEERPKAGQWAFYDDLEQFRQQFRSFTEKVQQQLLQASDYKLSRVQVTPGTPYADNKMKQFVTPYDQETKILFYGNNILKLQSVLAADRIFIRELCKEELARGIGYSWRLDELTVNGFRERSLEVRCPPGLTCYIQGGRYPLAPDRAGQPSVALV